MEIRSYLHKNIIYESPPNVKHGAEAIVLKGTLPFAQGDLAIKQWPEKFRGKDKKRNIEREVSLLIQNPHNNIIEFLGILINDQSEWIGYVMPYMAMGSLDAIIHDKNKNYDDIYTKKQIKHWIVEICSGLSYLHFNNIIHRDVKPRNILLGKSYNEVKLSDFGIARSIDSITHSLSTGCGTPIYMAPEIFQGVYNISTDIYSLSITIWEIFMRRYPFDHTNCSNMWELQRKISRGERPQLTNELSRELSNLLKRSWHHKSSKRPAIIEIVDFFKETILLTGGWNGSLLNSFLLLVNNRTNWKQLNIQLPYAVDSHGAQFLKNSLYIFGGEGKGDTFNSTYKLSKSLQWEKMANMNKKRSGISNSSVILNNKIWVCGGSNRIDGPLKSVEMYDPETNEWKYMREMNECRRSAAAAVLNGKIFCSGGWNRYSLNSVEYYDPSSDIWTLVCNMPQTIGGHGAVEIDGNLIVIGESNTLFVIGEDIYFKNVWALDTRCENAVWIDKPFMSIPRSDFSIAKIDEEVFVCGGRVGDFELIDSMEIFDGKVWTNGPKMPTYRRCAPAVVIPMQFARDLEQFTAVCIESESIEEKTTKEELSGCFVQ